MPYSYLWNNGETTQDISGLSADLYSVTVSDANGCMESDMALIDEPVALNISSVITEPSCSGSSNGAIDVSVSGGTGPYSFDWTNGATNEDISGLIAGSYSLTVTDATGCLITETIELLEPDVLSLDSSSTNPDCANEASGSATVIASGGTAPYFYSWSNGETTSTIENLVAGSYNVSVTDNNGCMTTGSLYLVDPEPLAVVLSASNPTCEGLCNGSITAVVTGGIAPYSYSWDNGASTANLTDLCEGSYELTVIDANGCTFVVTQDLTWETILTGTIDVSDATCADMCNGYAIAVGAGGDGSYTYQWSDGKQAPSVPISALTSMR